MAMAIADASHVIDEVWFVAEGSVVKILNFAGTVKGNISFSVVVWWICKNKKLRVCFLHTWLS